MIVYYKVQRKRWWKWRNDPGWFVTAVRAELAQSFLEEFDMPDNERFVRLTKFEIVQYGSILWWDKFENQWRYAVMPSHVRPFLGESNG